MVSLQASQVAKLRVFSNLLNGNQWGSAGGNVPLSPPCDQVTLKSYLESEQKRVRSRLEQRINASKRIFRLFGLHRVFHEINAFVETDADVLFSYLSSQTEIFLRRTMDADQASASEQITTLIELLQGRLQVKSHKLHQQPCSSMTTAKRAALIAEYLTPASTVLCLGDDDFVSVALASTVGNEVTVIDLDRQVLSIIEEISRDQNLRITTHLADICRPLPPPLLSAFDVVVTDPIYFVRDMMNFLSAAEQCLSKSAGAALLSCCSRALAGPAWRTVEDWARSRSLAAERYLDGFNEYPKPVRTQTLLTLGERLFCRTPLTRACLAIPDAFSDVVVFRRIKEGESS
jgi:hypothetical protein